MTERTGSLSVPIVLEEKHAPKDGVIIDALHLEKSVLRYCHEATTNDLCRMLSPFAKDGVVLDEKFVLKDVLGKKQEHIDANGDGLFCTDGQYSFALGYLRGKDEKPLWIAVASFATDEVASRYRTSLFKRGVETDYECNLPLIVQIQGPAVWSYDNREKYKDAKKILAKLRWEKAMLKLLLDWAEQNSIPALYLLPSKMNQHRNISKNIDDSLHIRYDVTAKRMGFIQQGEGFFKKEIDTNPGSLWEMLDKECAG